VLLDGVRVIPEMPLVVGANLTWHRPPWREPEAPLEYRVLHRDAQVLAVDKPAGLPTLPGGGFLDHTLLALVRRNDPGATPIHRLGRWTSGVVLFALTPEARTHLARALRLGLADKRYRALASGSPESSRWEIAVPIGPVPHRFLGTVHAVNPRGAPARTTVSVLERRQDSFLAEVAIATGKPHQIRIHLAAAGFPLVGDPLYPAGEFRPRE
jgi:23S rRNA pseudouridine1911/1915/1917 synthase